MGTIASGSVPLSELSHSEELIELVSDTIADPLASGDIEHTAHPVDAIAEVSQVRTHVLTQGGSDIQVELVNHGSGRHFVLIDHARSMAAIRAKVNPPNDHQNLWVTLGGIIDSFPQGCGKLYSVFHNITIHNHLQTSVSFVSLVSDPYSVLSRRIDILILVRQNCRIHCRNRA